MIIPYSDIHPTLSLSCCGMPDFSLTHLGHSGIMQSFSPCTFRPCNHICIGLLETGVSFFMLIGFLTSVAFFLLIVLLDCDDWLFHGNTKNTNLLCAVVIFVEAHMRHIVKSCWDNTHHQVLHHVSLMIQICFKLCFNQAFIVIQFVVMFYINSSFQFLNRIGKEVLL